MARLSTSVTTQLEEYYWSDYNKASALCSDDSHYYQSCGTHSTVKQTGVTISNILCGGFLCKSGGSFWNILAFDYSICDGVYDCVNTELDEEGCSALITMPSGEKITSNKICNDVCNSIDTDCEDEATCNGYSYGMYCDIRDEAGIVKYIPPHWICDGEQDCDNGEDEANCTVTNETLYTCEQDSTSGVTVPVHNFTRCTVLDVYYHKYCSDYASSQTNCSDPTRVGVRCLVNGYLSSVSKYMICLGETAICDDNFENQCIQTSSQCTVHRHLLCDGQSDCNDQSDETGLICNTMTL